jgi:2,3-dihydroxy-p-cumate/2,3-dihydroxybenzoate 3,4-dioxygenase
MISAEDEETYIPRQFPTVPTSYCVWGSRPDIAEFKSDEAVSNAA